MEDCGGTSLRGHKGDLLASGPALVFVLHLGIRCGSRTPGLELLLDRFTRGRVLCEELSFTQGLRVVCITTECLETSSHYLF